MNFDDFIADFLAEKFGISESEAQDMNRELVRTYGSSLAGLRVIILLIILPNFFELSSIFIKLCFIWQDLGYDIHPDDYHR